MSRNDWKIRAVLLGSLVNIGGSMVIGMLFLGIAMVSLAAAGAPRGDLSDRMMRSVGGLLVLTAIGTAFTVLGGYIAARISKTRQMLHALATGIPYLLIGFMMGRGSTPLWSDALSYALLFPAAALGGHWARARTRGLPQTPQP